MERIRGIILKNIARPRKNDFLYLENGILSHDAFSRVISSIDSEYFEHCFIKWVSELIKITDVK